jgi:hypothetical protein
MKVEINGKVYTARTSESNRIKIIEDFDDSDIIFFKKWMDESYDKDTGESRPKREYVKDINFTSKIHSGTFINCFPYELEEEYVVLAYDAINIL